MGGRKFKILVCRGPECGERWNSRAIHEAFREGLAAEGLEGRVELGWQSCFGRCRQGPNALICELDEEEEGPGRLLFTSLLARRGPAALYNQLEPRDVVELIEEHVLRGRFVRRLMQPPARSARRSNPEPGQRPTSESRRAEAPDDGDS